MFAAKLRFGGQKKMQLLARKRNYAAFYPLKGRDVFA